MAFDGSMTAALAAELNRRLQGGRISKIAQPEKDELQLTVKTADEQLRLLISADPSLPMIYITGDNKAAPLQAPAFCMLLRKHIQSGRIISVTQPSMERVIDILIEHYDEMGDLCRRTLTVELMGKHSNIIFRDEDRIIDSIRRVSSIVSSVREVLPGRQYFIPFSGDKLDPFECGPEEFVSRVCSGSLPLYKSLYTSLTGFSPELAEETAYRAGIDGERPSGSLEPSETASLYDAFSDVMQIIKSCSFDPCIYMNEGVPEGFSAFPLEIYKGRDIRTFDSPSELLYTYYSERQSYTTMRQKTADLRQTVQTLLSRDIRKGEIQEKQLADTDKMDRYRTYGELLTAFGYSVEPKSTSFTTVDYNTGKEVTIPLDPSLSAMDNARRFFERYNKLKRTRQSLEEITQETASEIEHLETILSSLDTARNEADIDDIRREMAESGYVRARTLGKKKPAKAVKSEPLHYISSDGFHIYVGKNNFQNEYITFKLANGNDWWFHAKKRPGSHVIVKTEGRELPDRTFEEAASLAAHYSRSDGESRIEVDYIQCRFIKKPGGARPGYVIYHTNYSMTAESDISMLREL